MINYLVFPGVTDQMEEIEAMMDFIKRTKVNFIHLKNLNIDPQLYLGKMPPGGSKTMGMKKILDILGHEFPEVQFGYFNQPVRR
jgi:pyruvate-formate lyase-activating enzyme